MEHECYVQTPSPGNFVWVFVGLFARGGGSTAVAVTLDTVADEDKTADGVTRSSAWFCSRDGKICYYERLEYDFLLLCLAGYFSYFLLPNLGMFIFFGFFRLCSSSHLVLFLSSQQVRML